MTASSPRTVTLVLPWPPSVNGYWRSVIRGKFASQIISERGREFRGAVGLAASLHNIEHPFVDPVTVEIVLHRADNRRYDVDNYAKAIFDGLTHAAVWQDDSLVHELVIRKGKAHGENSIAVVTITEAAQ